MNTEQLQHHWALILASAAALLLLIVFVHHLIRRSASAQLRRMRKALDEECAKLSKAGAAVEKAERRKARLMERADRVKPRLLTESAEALQDARALAKIARDRVLVAENQLRRVIFEEFPPAEHEKLRSRYLPTAPMDKKPFTF
jgi:hypothetical protein